MISSLFDRRPHRPHSPDNMIDIGVNLTNSQLLSDHIEIIDRAKTAGLTHCVVTGTSVDESAKAIELIESLETQYSDFLSCTTGVHPHDAKDWQPSYSADLKALASHSSVVAIGEAGLDFHRNFSPPEKQIEAFEAQVAIAIETGKPMFLHERDAFKKQQDILQYHRDDLSRAVIHCFTGDKKALFAYLDLDFHIGITGWVCDERRGQDLAAIVSNIPLDRLMVETDAPYLLPRNIAPKPKSRVNEPAYLPWVIKKVAGCFDLPESKIAASTTDTAIKFFDLNTDQI